MWCHFGWSCTRKPSAAMLRPTSRSNVFAYTSASPSCQRLAVRTAADEALIHGPVVAFNGINRGIRPDRRSPMPRADGIHKCGSGRKLSPAGETPPSEWPMEMCEPYLASVPARFHRVWLRHHSNYKVRRSIAVLPTLRNSRARFSQRGRIEVPGSLGTRHWNLPPDRRRDVITATGL